MLLYLSGGFIGDDSAVCHNYAHRVTVDPAEGGAYALAVTSAYAQKAVIVGEILGQLVGSFIRRYGLERRSRLEIICREITEQGLCLFDAVFHAFTDEGGDSGFLVSVA